MFWIVVFDTNILLSALLSPAGKPMQCMALVREGRIESVTCIEILDEFQDKLVTKFDRAPDRARAAADEIRGLSRVVTIPHALRVVRDDPTDNKIVECAEADGAMHIVSGDKHHLLSLGRYEDIAIVSAANFLALVSGDEQT